jgi:hypothetical protein
MTEPYNPTPNERFWAAIGAQAAGALLLLSIGNVFPVGRTDLSEGLGWIHCMAAVAIAALVVGLLLFKVAKYRCKDSNTCVDTVILTILAFDIPIVTFLVCQQGGLSRSMFVPLFFLIPAAHLAVERPGKRYRVYVVASFIAVGMIFSWFVSWRNLVNIWSWPVTDFSTLAAQRFATAILIVSLISLFIPLLQWGIIKLLPEEERTNIPVPAIPTVESRNASDVRQQ